MSVFDELGLCGHTKTFGSDYRPCIHDWVRQAFNEGVRQGREAAAKAVEGCHGAASRALAVHFIGDESMPDDEGDCCADQVIPMCIAAARGDGAE